LGRIGNIYFFSEKWREKANEVKMAEIAAFGEPLMGFYHVKEKGKNNSYFQMTIGGDTSNVVLQLAKLGHSAKYITKLGKDYFGENILRKWKEWNVDCSNVIIDSNHLTGVYFVIFDDKGKHKFVYKRENSAAANYTVEDAKKVNLEGVKVFHFSGITQAISKSSLETSFYFAEKCKSKGILISYDLNYRKLLWSKDYFSSVANYTIRTYADIVTLNLEEAEALGILKNPEEIVKDILNYGPRIVALKLGEKGCIIGDHSGKIAYRQSRKVKVMDTVGAGDAFTAGIISGILKGMEIEKIADYANLIASSVCTAVGPTEGQLTKKDLDNFFKEGGDSKVKSSEKNKIKSKFNKGRR
jgi:2-dehydro-3-deoxygluconokinase